MFLISRFRTLRPTRASFQASHLDFARAARQNRRMSSSALVTVTGASGFIAAHIIRDLLERGYHVTGTVRDAAKRSALGRVTAMPAAADRLDLVEADC